MSDAPHEHGQPEVDAIDAFNDRVMLFSDGECGAITHWIDSRAVSHESPHPDTVAVVARHPGNFDKPWYSAALGEDELYRPPTP